MDSVTHVHEKGQVTTSDKVHKVHVAKVAITMITVPHPFMTGYPVLNIEKTLL